MAWLRECPDEDALLAFVSGESSSLESAALERHLDGCEVCSELVALLARSPLVDSSSDAGSDDRSSDGSDTDAPLGDVSTILPRRLVRGDTVGRYIVLDELGHGGMGVVYAGYDPDVDRKLALKFLRPRLARDTQGRARLLREAKTLGAVSHPNIVTVFDVGTEGDQVFIAMELVVGRTLRDWVAGSRVDWRTVARCYADAGRGLVAAHALGIVHRDFKPSNAILGDDGRVVVVDFGLALADRAPRIERAADSGGRTTTTQLSAAGLVVGTPTYMAPEQAAGGRASVASDQYSFCVSLCEALVEHASTPGASDGPADLTRVPRALRSLLRRGLSEDPSRRHPSMAALVRALDKAIARPLRWTSVGATLAVVSTGVWLAVPGEDACAAERATLDSIWGAPRRRQAAAAFGSTELPYAERSWEYVRSELDRWSEGWIEASDVACEAGDSRVADARRVCLNFHRATLAELVDLLVVADAGLVARAPNAAAGLPDVARCLNPVDADPLPEDPEQRAEIESTLEALAELTVRIDAHRVDGLVERAREVVSRADRTEHRPTVAHARLELGRACMRVGETACAEEEFHEAIWSAEAARDAFTAAKAWTVLVWLYAYHLQDRQSAQRAGRHAEAALARIGGDEVIETVLGNHLAWSEMQAGELRSAEARLRALLVRRSVPAGRKSEIMLSLSNVLAAQSRYEDAAEVLREAEAQTIEAIGTDHPTLLAVRVTRARLLSKSGQPQEAENLFRQALQSALVAFGPGHDVVARVRANLGGVLSRAGRLAEARVEFELAAEAFEARHGPRHEGTRQAKTALASLHLQADNLEEALAGFEGVLSELRATEDPDPLALLGPTVQRALVLVELGRLDEAERDLETAMEILKTKVEGDSPKLVRVLNTLGRIRREQGRFGDALVLHERAAGLARRVSRTDLARTLRKIGECNVQMGEPVAAILVLREALSAHVASGSASKFDEGRIRETLARALLANDQPGDALAEGQRALEAFSDLESPEMLKSTQAWLDENFAL